MSTVAEPAPRVPGLARLAIFVTLAAAVSAVTVYLTTPADRSTAGDAPAPPDKAPGLSATGLPLFRTWPAGKTPDLALVLSAQEYGYVQPCGCSRPQLGGLERRYNFVQALRDKGWPVVGVDLGDVIQRKGILDQAMLKYDLSLAAMEKMGYAAVGVGLQEMEMPLMGVLARYPLQNAGKPPRVLAANLTDKAKAFPGPPPDNSLVGDWQFVPPAGGAPGLAVTAVVAPAVVAEAKDASLRFHTEPWVNPATGQQEVRPGNRQVLARVLGEMAAHQPAPDLRVLLYQGKPEGARDAAALRAADPANPQKPLPGFQVVLCQDTAEEPTAFPVRLDAAGKPLARGRDDKDANAHTLVVSVGFKGRYVGVVGAFRTGDPARPFELHYELVPLGEEYETPADAKSGHPVLALLEGYTKQLRDEDFLSKQPKKPHPVQAQFPGEHIQFVGSDRCVTCHAAESKVWAGSKHSHAYEALAAAKNPSNRQFDNQCVVCHTVGFDYQDGYADRQRTPHLKGVGCESCHGPGSAHVMQPKAAKFYAGLSPWKAKPDDKLTDKVVLNRADGVCQKCHDTDNDPHFRFETYWPKIAHSGLGKK